MNDNHIIEILDRQPSDALSESESMIIQRHIGECAPCQKAYAAARLATMLLKERVDEAAHNTAHANPFFQTRVLAAWREQQAGGAWNLGRLWKATGAMVASMAATTAALAVLMFAAPAANTSDQQTPVLLPYSAETVVLEQINDNQLTNDQVISAIYDEDDEGK